MRIKEYAFIYVNGVHAAMSRCHSASDVVAQARRHGYAYADSAERKISALPVKGVHRETLEGGHGATWFVIRLW